MISFLAYHGNAGLRHEIIERIAALIEDGSLTERSQGGGRRAGLVEALAGGRHDLLAAYLDSGFPVGLLMVGDSIHQGLPLEEAPEFVLELAQAASIDADIGDVPSQFLKWMFEQAVADLGTSRIRATAREAGPIFKQLADASAPTPLQAKKAKALAKRTRRQGRSLPSPKEALVAEALGAALDRAGENAGHAVRWIANLSGQPADQYRRYARKLIELVETA